MCLFLADIGCLVKLSKQPLSNFDPCKPWKYKQPWGLRPGSIAYKKVIYVQKPQNKDSNTTSKGFAVFNFNFEQVFVQWRVKYAKIRVFSDLIFPHKDKIVFYTPLKTSESLWFTDVFRGYRIRLCPYAGKCGSEKTRILTCFTQPEAAIGGVLRNFPKFTEKHLYQRPELY